MANTKSKLVEGVDVFTEEPNSKPKTTKSKSVAKRTATQKAVKMSRADKINALYHKAQSNIGNAVEAEVPTFIEIGNELLAQKDELEHGEWIDWIEDNLDFGRRQASTYMRVARNGNLSSHLDSVTEARKLLTVSKPAPVESDDDEPSEVPEGMITQEELVKKLAENTAKAKEAYEEDLKESDERLDKLGEELEKLKAANKPTEEAEKEIKKLEAKQVRLKKHIEGVEALEAIKSEADKVSKALAGLTTATFSASVVKNYKTYAKTIKDALDNLSAFLGEQFHV